MPYPSDCLICAIRPSLFFCKFNIFAASYSCHHSSPPTSPLFSVSTFFQCVSFFCNVVLLGTIINDFLLIYQGLQSEHLFVFMEIAIHVCMIYCNTCYIIFAKLKAKEYNGLVCMIDHKKLYGVKCILTERDCEAMVRSLLLLTIGQFVLEIISLGFTFGLTFDDPSRWFGVLCSEISMYTLMSLIVFFVQNSWVYKILLKKWIEETQLCLNTSENRYINAKIEMMGRWYMTLRSNFSLSSSYFSSKVIVAYMAKTVLLLICQTYIILLYFRGKIVVEKYHYQVLIKSFMVVIGMFFICYEAEQLNNMLKKPLSLLLKFPVSRLSNSEAVKVEHLMKILVAQDMGYHASEFFTVKLNFIVSIAATGLTYVLVALQFKLFW